MKQGLISLNRISKETAMAALLRCCGSTSWAGRMVEERPYTSVSELHQVAREIWMSLDETEWLDAFQSHPRIGDRQAASDRSARDGWARTEQAGALAVDLDVRRRLAEANKAYSARFGFIFIICATGKTAGEMLASLESRLQNDRETELTVAAEQQAQITALRLNKLLTELGDDA